MNRRFNLAENENPDQNQENNQPRMGAGFFVIMMLAFPLQYYLTDSYGGEYIFWNYFLFQFCFCLRLLAIRPNFSLELL